MIVCQLCHICYGKDDFFIECREKEGGREKETLICSTLHPLVQNQDQKHYCDVLERCSTEHPARDGNNDLTGELHLDWKNLSNGDTIF